MKERYIEQKYSIQYCSSSKKLKGNLESAFAEC